MISKPRLGKFGRISAVIGMSGAAAATALALTPGTFGGFTASSSNPGNSVQAGTVTMSNSVGDGTALTLSNATDTGYGDTNLAPGHSVSGSVTITNSGSLPATVTLSITNVTFKDANGNTVSCSGNTPPALCSDYSLTVVDGEGTPVTVFDGTLANTSNPISVKDSAGHSTWTATTGADTFKATVTLNTGAHNEAQGSTASFDLDWASSSV